MSGVGRSNEAFSLPSSAKISRWSAFSCAIAPWAYSIASITSASGTSLAPASIITIESSVPATIRSMSDSAISS